MATPHEMFQAGKCRARSAPIAIRPSGNYEQGWRSRDYSAEEKQGRAEERKHQAALRAQRNRPKSASPESMGEDNIRWIEVAGGFLAARARPRGASTLEAWGCTSLVNLIEDGQAMESAAAVAGVKWVSRAD